jgi:hypothetical protein
MGGTRWIGKPCAECVGIVTSLLAEIERRGPQELLARLDTLPDEQASLLHAGLLGELLDRCRADGEAFLRFVLTRDEADAEQSVKPFPVGLAYLCELWRTLARDQRVVIAKSRQMLVSWIVCAFCVWWARFHPHQAIFWQSQQWEDAAAMVSQAEGQPMGRCQFIERHLPTWLQQDIKPQKGVIAYPNGSFIQAVAGGPDQIRGKVPSVYVGDEFAKQVEATGVYQTLAPLLQKGARAILIGTPNGTQNMFATIYHGRPVGVERP